MKIQTLLSVTALSAALAACGGGDVIIDAQNNSPVDNSIGDNSNNVDNGGETPTTPTTNPCASYTDASGEIQGDYNAATGDCTYRTNFVSLNKPYVGEGELFLADLPNDGVHIFNGSLVIGQNYDNDADRIAAGIMQGGDGSVLRIEAGATLAFRSADDYFVINRGSQVFAEGEAGAPITVTSVSDAVDGTVDPEADGEWGGMIINGFGVTNKCEYTGSVDDGTIAIAPGEECNVEAEGKAGAGQTHYGGDNNDDNSGVLNYFIVKHTGAQVAAGNELNGISFDAVGAGTLVDYLQAYSTLDDGIEMFGGAVNISHYIGMHVRDDSIDIDEGYRGTISHALVIQSENYGNQCVESDGIGSHDKKDQATITDFITRGLHSQAKINNLTCIISPSNQGTRGEGAGIRIREAHMPEIKNTIMTTAYGAETNPGTEDHFCLRIEHESGQAALDDKLKIEDSVFACTVLTKGDLNGSSTLDWLNLENDTMATLTGGENPADDATDVNIALFTNGFYSLPVADMVINGGAVTATPDNDLLGAVSMDDDWTANWAYGLHEGNRGQALWFVAE
ncbi:serine/threonine protein kinase [Saccharophagus degradans]|uniref:serine/threonine protein kinase n=1 Tax=Saccharophagus degradans TaxID=86304 RepID=UPI003A7F7A56